jgi:hypothetical protein
MTTDSIRQANAKRCRKNRVEYFAGYLPLVHQSRRCCREAKQKSPMGTIKQGILGGFNGRVGNVIGSTWKGRSVMKIRPASVTNPNTERQQQQRSKFSLVGRFNRAHRNLIRIGFRAYTKDMTAMNAAMSYNLANAVSGTAPDLYIDFSKAALSNGYLAALENPVAESTLAAAVSLSWTDNSLASNAHESDQLIVSVFDSATDEVCYFAGAATRQAGIAVLNLPANWSTRTVEVFTFLVALEGLASSPDTVSKTVYAGSVEIM